MTPKNLYKSASAVLCISLTVCQLAWAGDGVPVTSVTTLRTAATPSGPYNIGGNIINYGVGDNVRITGANVGGLDLTRSAISKPQIDIKRKDNIIVQGERLTLFYPGQTSGTTINIEGDEATSMEIAMNDDYLTSAGLDVFLNRDTGVEKANNIERIDFVVSNGISLPSTPALLNEIGTIANEKHGNNTYKIALITALDAFSEPAAFGNLRTVQGNVDYGNVGRPQNSSGTNLRNLYIRNGETPVGGGGNGPMEYIRSDTNFIGLSFISFDALGATAGQTVYGYSLFANDMTDSLDLVGLSNAPTNTSGNVNGGDIYGGTFAIFSSAAAEAQASEGAASLQAQKTVEVYDPLNEGLYAIPGNDVIYDITVTNSGTASPDDNSLFLVDELPSDIIFFDGDIDDGGPLTDPVEFIDNSSGLSFDASSDVGYSTGSVAPTTFTACNYPSLGGYDSNITHVCFRPTGEMSHGTPNPSFSLRFRAQIK